MAEAEAAVARLREHEYDLALDIQRAEQARREAEARRRKLMAALAGGEDVPPSAIEGADAAISEAEARVSHRQEAMPLAEAETKRAEKVLAAVKRDELRRRVARIEAAAREARERWLAGQADFGRLDVLRVDTDRVVRSAHSAADLDVFLARSAEFAEGAPADA